ncbi:hypothetical protein MNBD_GAMMA10-2338 [hydrothermal vent metagenome]|uniref:ATPase domain-containing protein n=1 Tax=hydrothermal vent metagenome TaxID=652676 RepID=A0A3B0XQ07_9ZZZZ
MNNIVGQAVRNTDFWNRKSELAAIWDAIESGSHLLISAPRRVGKTSILYKIMDEPKPGFIPVYVDTESADSENEFWQKLFNALRAEEFVNKLESMAKTLWDKIKNIKISKISADGVIFDDGKALSYKESFMRLINDLGNGEKIVFMIDEFAQTIENIIKYEGSKNALSLLKAHRALRQDAQISNKLTFVYAGSIGLESVVAKMHATKHINDLNSIKIMDLSVAEAKKFAHKLSADININIPDEQITYLLEKIEWFIPFYIQLIIQEIRSLHRRELAENLPVTNTQIDNAINNALDHRNHFESWHSKLKEGHGKNEYLFAKQVLNIISEKLSIMSLDIINIALKHSLDEDVAREILHSLVYDGYINNDKDIKLYRFNSPVLRLWWCRNVAN